MPNAEYANKKSMFNKTLLPNGVIHWSEAKNHIGEQVSVYGEVASTYFDWDEYVRWIGYPEFAFDPPPTFIELGAKFPNKELVKLVIWGRDRDKFQRPPDEAFKNSTVIVTGVPYLYADIVTIKVIDPANIRTLDPIPNLYVDADTGKDADPNYVRVFTIRDEEGEASSHTSFYDDYDDFDDVGYHEYEDCNGREVTQIGDYFYDDDGNCVDEPRERSPYEWHHRLY